MHRDIWTENLKDKLMCRWKEAVKIDFEGII
jgi:hypothetical protein